MEVEASAEVWLRRREHPNGGGRFRAEIAMDRGSSAIPRGPEFGFAAAVREPLVRLRRPKYDFEMWDWSYFAWPHDRLDANLEMRDRDPEATLEADRKASESFLNRNTLQLERYAMGQEAHEQHAAAWSSKQLDDSANLEMRNSGPEVTLEVHRKASESSLDWSTLQLERYSMDQNTQEKHAAALPCNQLYANVEMRDSHTDRKASESFLNPSTQPVERCPMYQHTQEQHAAALPHNLPDVNQGMRDCNREVTLEADQKASGSLSSRSTLKLKRREMDQDQHTQKQYKEEADLWTSLLVNSKPAGRRSTRLRGCAEANGILGEGRVVQGSWAC